jgi:hypothetical protein
VVRCSQLWPLIEAAPGRQLTPISVALLVGLPIGLSLAAPRLPIGRRRVLLVAVALAPLPVLLVTSGLVKAAILALLVVVPACVLGRAAMGAWLRTTPLEAWVIGGAVGIGLLAALTYGLGIAGQIGWHTTLPVAVLLALVAAVAGGRALRDDLARLRAWLWETPSWDWAERAMIGLIVGVGWLALIWMCAPEIMTDAVSVRLAMAADIVKTGQLAPNPDRLVVWRPGLSELVYAFVLTVGPIEATHVVGLIVALACAAGVGAVALRLGGSRAALPAVTVLATFPQMLWLCETASADVFAVLYALACLLVLVGPGSRSWRARLVAALCLLLGAGVKASFAIVAVGFVIVAVPQTLGALGRARARMVAGAGLLVIVAVLGAAILNLALASRLLAPLGIGGSSWATLDAQVAVLGRFGAGRSLSAFLTAPFDITFHAGRYGEIGDGAAGYLLLALVPLAPLARPGRLAWQPLLIAAAAYPAWFLTTQYLRYAMPVAALLAAVSGVAGSWAATLDVGRRARSLVGGGVVLLAVLSVGGYVGVLLAYPGELPWRVALGLEDRTAYIARSRSDFATIQRLWSEPGLTRVASNRPGLAHLYAPTIVNPLLSPGQPGQESALKDETTLMGVLTFERYSHLIVDRSSLPLAWYAWPWFDEAFLQRNTTLVGGAQNVYLYRILPPEARGQANTWVSGPELVANGGLEPDEHGSPAGWIPTGAPSYDNSGLASHAGRGAVRAGPAGSYAAIVPVTPGTTYLLTHFTRAASVPGMARLQINWADASGGLAGVSLDLVPATTLGYHRWSMPATAPSTATTAVILLAGHDVDIWFDDVSLRAKAAS